MERKQTKPLNENGVGDPNRITSFEYMDIHCTDGESEAHEGHFLVQDFENQLYWDNLGSSQCGERSSLPRTAMDGGKRVRRVFGSRENRWSLEGGSGGGRG